jgi:hypothetical protein
MAQRTRLTRAEVEERLSEDQQAKLSELFQLAQILESSIITADYRPSDDLRNAIGLSAYGNWLLQQSKKFEFEVREGRLACLLDLFHLDVLVDIDSTDLLSLAEAITTEMKSGRLQFPMIFGPDLYMRAAELFPDERRELNSADTQRLLEDQPIGVFQLGPWLGGPWGLYRHSVSRRIGPSHAVPLQHCHDVSCWGVHKVWLSSDSSAEIIKARTQVRKALESEGDEPSEFAPVLANVLSDPAAKFNADSLGAVGFLIGDALSVSELGTLLQHLLDGRDAKSFRQLIVNLSGLAGSSSEIIADLGRAHLLQLALLADDQQLARALDDLVLGHAGDLTISVPVHEVRRSVLTRATASDFGSRPELSNLGLRTSSHAASAPLKLRRLVDSIYFPIGGESALVAELEWQLRSLPGVSIEASLTEFLRKTPPQEVLKKLVLNSRENVKRGSTALSLDITESVTDNEIVDRMLWKLGFDVAGGDQLHEDFWRHSDRLRKAAEAASVSTSVGEEEIGEISASYFRALEKLLGDTLVFCTWALTTDHVREDDPYRYVENGPVLTKTTDLLGPGLAAKGDILDSKVSVEQWTLQPLCRGFQVLSEALAAMEASESEYVRASTSIPDFSGQTTIQRFPFKHYAPFLDLTPSSQQRIHLALKDATKSLLKSRASEIRNGLLHYRRSNVDLARLVDSLVTVESVIRNLEAQGLVRIVFRRQRAETDRWGRSLHTLVDAAGTERAISRPSAYAWINLPALDKPQYLMTVAQFDQMGEYLRFRPGSESDFMRLWSGVPQRREESVVSRTRSDQDQPTAGQA